MHGDSPHRVFGDMKRDVAHNALRVVCYLLVTLCEFSPPLLYPQEESLCQSQLVPTASLALALVGGTVAGGCPPLLPSPFIATLRRLQPARRGQPGCLSPEEAFDHFLAVDKHLSGSQPPSGVSA